MLVIVIEHFRLCRLADQFVESGPDHGGYFLDDLPLGRGRQRNPQTCLQPLQPIERNAAPVLQQRDHRRRAFIVLFLAHLLRRFRLVNLTAQVAAQAFEFIDRGRNRRLAYHSDAQRRLLLLVNLAFQALRTTASWFQGGVRDFDPASPSIRLGAIAAMSRLLILVLLRRGTAGRRGFDPRLLQHLARLLRARLCQQRAQLTDRGVLLPDPLDQVAQRVDRGFEPLTILFAQGPLARSLP